MSNADFGALLRQYRRSTGMTQQQLADLSTLSVRAIRDLELGYATRPRRETVRLLAEGLGLEWSRRVALEVTAGRDPSASELQAAHDGGAVAPPAVTHPISGREQEVKALTDLLGSRRRRRLDLVGLGGVGKTRLAQEVSAIVHRQLGASVLWLPAPGHAATGGSIHNVLTMRMTELMSAPELDVARAAQVVGPRDALLVLDGWGAWLPDGHVVELLAHLPQVRVLTTSREAGTSAVDVVFPVAPLAVPTARDEADVGRLAAVGSVRLLSRLLRQTRPGLTLTRDNAGVIAALCRDLDGLPGALRLVAHWGLVYSPEELLSLVRQDLRALESPSGSPADENPADIVAHAVAASAAGERSLLRRLAGVDGEWSVFDAADHVGGRIADVSRHVHHLLVRGLIRRNDDPRTSRFSVLNLVRAAHPAGR